MRSVITARWKWFLVAGVLAFGLVAAVQWHSIAFGVAAGSSESRPELLSEAEWGKPDSAVHFSERFAAGTPESKLLEWLRANSFAVDERDTRAERRVRALPCNELIEVDWDASAHGTLKAARATVTETGCL